MGYQLPKLGNVAFPGFGALGKQQAKERTARSKEGKDRGRRAISRSSSTPSSPISSSLPAITAARPSCDGKLLDKAFLQKWRRQLRPLLDSIRLVEASTRESSNGGACRIGPFQISRQYHQDAWKNSPPVAWSRCRDLDHAENTIVAYWLQTCPEALKRHDFEMLAKIHKEGIQGSQKEEVQVYWAKVNQHLNKHAASESKKENAKWNIFLNEKSANLNRSNKLNEKSLNVLSPINSNSLLFLTTPRSSCAIPAKQQLPSVLTLRPKLFQQTFNQEGKKLAGNGTRDGARSASAGSKDGVCKMTAEKAIRQTSHTRSNKCCLKPNSLGHAFNISLYNLSHTERRKWAVIFVQAYWRMRYARKRFMKMHNAALVIQQRWRKHHCNLAQGQRNHDEEAGHYSMFLERTPPSAEKQRHLGPRSSPCELLYRADISPAQEDQLLTELVSLLNLDTESLPIDSCNSFRFPHPSEEFNEACTPKMKPDCLNYSMYSPKLCAEASSKALQVSTIKDVESTPLTVKQALLSPLMETEIIAELAKLFPLCQGGSQAIQPSTSIPSARSSQTTQEYLLHEHNGKDGIIRRLTFNDTQIQAEVLDIDNGVADAATASRSEQGTGICQCYEEMNANSKVYEEELKEITIPLLADQSPVMTAKRLGRNQNPSKTKVERALVSSLSDWQCSLSSEDNNKEDETLRCMPSSVKRTYSSTSENTSLLHLKSLCTREQQPSDISRSVEDGNGRKTCVSVNLHPDCLLETSDIATSTIYAKAIFRCANFSLNIDNLLMLEPRCTEYSAARCRNPSITRVASLQHLCMLWDVNDIDLLTRSLKFKGLRAAQYQCKQEGDLALAVSEAVTDIQSEIDYLETLARDGDEKCQRTDMVLHQRDQIYTNIAAFTDFQERQHLYEKWEIQKVLTGRLRKIVYEQLWIDPKK